MATSRAGTRAKTKPRSTGKATARSQQAEIRLRLIVEHPVPGVALSLQDKDGRPVGSQTPTHADVIFEFAVRVARDGANGWRFFGDHVRSEGPTRRFVYVGVGKHAGQAGSAWDRRMKIDIHDIPSAVLDKATTGAVAQGAIAGTGEDGTPACASVALTKRWRAVAERSPASD